MGNKQGLPWGEGTLAAWRLEKLPGRRERTARAAILGLVDACVRGDTEVELAIWNTEIDGLTVAQWLVQHAQTRPALLKWIPIAHARGYTITGPRVLEVVNQTGLGWSIKTQDNVTCYAWPGKWIAVKCFVTDEGAGLDLWKQVREKPEWCPKPVKPRTQPTQPLDPEEDAVVTMREADEGLAGAEAKWAGEPPPDTSDTLRSEGRCGNAHAGEETSFCIHAAGHEGKHWDGVREWAWHPHDDPGPPRPQAEEPSPDPTTTDSEAPESAPSPPSDQGAWEDCQSSFLTDHGRRERCTLRFEHAGKCLGEDGTRWEFWRKEPEGKGADGPSPAGSDTAKSSPNLDTATPGEPTFPDRWQFHCKVCGTNRVLSARPSDCMDCALAGVESKWYALQLGTSVMVGNDLEDARTSDQVIRDRCADPAVQAWLREVLSSGVKMKQGACPKTGQPGCHLCVEPVGAGEEAFARTKSSRQRAHVVCFDLACEIANVKRAEATA